MFDVDGQISHADSLNLPQIVVNQVNNQPKMDTSADDKTEVKDSSLDHFVAACFLYARKHWINITLAIISMAFFCFLIYGIVKNDTDCIALCVAFLGTIGYIGIPTSPFWLGYLYMQRVINRIEPPRPPSTFTSTTHSDGNENIELQPIEGENNHNITVRNQHI